MLARFAAHAADNDGCARCYSIRKKHLGDVLKGGGWVLVCETGVNKIFALRNEVSLYASAISLPGIAISG